VKKIPTLPDISLPQLAVGTGCRVREMNLQRKSALKLSSKLEAKKG